MKDNEITRVCIFLAEASAQKERIVTQAFMISFNLYQNNEAIKDWLYSGDFNWHTTEVRVLLFAVFFAIR